MAAAVGKSPRGALQHHRLVPDGKEGQLEEQSRYWQEHPWSATFDLISAEYGWTDEQILQLTPQRVLMGRDAILTRRAAEHRRQARLEQLATRHVVAAVYSAAGSKKAGAIANAIDFLREKVRRIARTESVIAGFGPPLISEEEMEARRGH